MHRDVGQFVATLSLSRLIVCGELGREIAIGARQAGMSDSTIVEMSDVTSAAEWLKKTVGKGDVVLVKASRGMKMEQIVQVLTGMKAVTEQAS